MFHVPMKLFGFDTRYNTAQYSTILHKHRNDNCTQETDGNRSYVMFVVTAW